MGDSVFLYYLQSVEIFLYDNDYEDDPLSLFEDSCYVSNLFIIKSDNEALRKTLASNRSAISICKFFLERIESALKNEDAFFDVPEFPKLPKKLEKQLRKWIHIFP